MLCATGDDFGYVRLYQYPVTEKFVSRDWEERLTATQSKPLTLHSTPRAHPTGQAPALPGTLGRHSQRALLSVGQLSDECGRQRLVVGLGDRAYSHLLALQGLLLTLHHSSPSPKYLCLACCDCRVNVHCDCTACHTSRLRPLDTAFFEAPASGALSAAAALRAHFPALHTRTVWSSLADANMHGSGRERGRERGVVRGRERERVGDGCKQEIGRQHPPPQPTTHHRDARRRR